jgi:hypothetical protein
VRLKVTLVLEIAGGILVAYAILWVITFILGCAGYID